MINWSKLRCISKTLASFPVSLGLCVVNSKKMVPLDLYFKQGLPIGLDKIGVHLAL
jgi:hypothetical protein